MIDAVNLSCWDTNGTTNLPHVLDPAQALQEYMDVFLFSWQVQFEALKNVVVQAETEAAAAEAEPEPTAA